MLIKIRKAQSTAEYAILFSLVVAAAVGVQSYVRRALQARVFDATDYLVKETATLGNTRQWESTEGRRYIETLRSTRDRTEDATKEFETTIKEESEVKFDSFERK